jgi:putative transposase
MYVAGLPYHVVQRGNNREACFVEPENYQFYLELWQQMTRRYGVAVHAYCLMTNHVHSLVTPQRPGSISDTMKVVGSRYAQYINLRYQRTGTLWEGRHRASLVQSERYLLCCYRYIELNPVRAGMVERPEEYRWSSYGINAWGDAGWLQPHEEYSRLGGHGRLALPCLSGTVQATAERTGSPYHSEGRTLLPAGWRRPVPAGDQDTVRDQAGTAAPGQAAKAGGR